MPLLVAWIQSKPDVQQLLRILGLQDDPRETCFYPLSYCFPSMNHTHITRNLCLHSFDSNYLYCQIYNSVSEWHAIGGIRVTVGIVCNVCIYEQREYFGLHQLDEDLQPCRDSEDPNKGSVWTRENLSPGSCRSGRWLLTAVGL